MSHPHTITETALLHALRWRYATKKFDPARKLPAATWHALEEALVLSPSSFGMQPWTFVVVDNPAIRTQLRAAAYNQSQVTDASHFVVLAIKKDVGEAHIDAHVERTASVHGIPRESLNGLRNMLMGTLVHGPVRPAINAWAQKQVYIALGNALTAAALLGIDTCPLEGLDPPAFDKILGLGERNLATTVAIAFGYRAADDHHAQRPKVRFAHQDVIIHI